MKLLPWSWDFLTQITFKMLGACPRRAKHLAFRHHIQAARMVLAANSSRRWPVATWCLPDPSRTASKLMVGLAEAPKSVRATMHLSQSRVQMSVSMVNSLGINLPVDDLKEFRCFDMSICKRTTDVSSSALKWLWPRWGQLREQDSSTPTGSSSMKV